MVNKKEQFDAGGPAFPAADLSKTQCLGQTLWDVYAAAALNGLAELSVDYDAPESQAAHAAKCADAMIAERKKRFGG